MQVILLEKIHRLGNLGDKVNVAPGYGRNFLIPTRKAVPATAANVAKFEEQRVGLERVQADALGRAQARAAQLTDMMVTIAAKAGAEGKLFGSVGTLDIAAALVAQGVEAEKREVRLPDGPLREIGDFDVEIHLHDDVNATVKVKIVPQDGASAA